MTKKTDEEIIELFRNTLSWAEQLALASSPNKSDLFVLIRQSYRLAESEALKEIESLKISHAVEMIDYGMEKIKVIREQQSINEQQTLKIVQLEQEIRELKSKQ
jgi:beta-lactamase class D